MSRRQIERCLSDGRLLRVRNGRYVTPDTHPDILQAAKLGGRLDCVSLLRLYGVFVLEGSPLHMQVTNGTSRLPPRSSRVVCHWRKSRAGREDLLADLIEALAQACRCQEPRAAVAMLDSAWHHGLVDELGVNEVFARLPRRYRTLRRLLDPRSESGPETLMRLILKSIGCDIQVQVDIAGVGRVDFIVDGWLIVECDSEAHHAGWVAQKRDRRRDIAAAEQGYTTIRPLAEDILFHRDEVAASVKALISRRAAETAVRNSSSKRPQPPAHGR